MPNFLNKPEYAKDKEKYIEENKEVYLTSCGYKSEETYTQFLDYKDKMLQGKEYFTIALPYTVAVEHGLLTRKRVENIKSDPSMTEASWLMEMCAQFYGVDKGAYFNIEEINACRTNKNMFYPPTNAEWISDKKKSWKMKKQKGEIRIMGMDIALMADQNEGKAKGKNDNTIIFCIRLLPDGDKYERHICYIESLHGEHSEKQALRLKQLYYDFEADYVALDTAGNSLSVYEYLNKTQFDDERNMEYPAFTTFNNDKMANRASRNAIPCIYGIKANAEFNHNIAMDLKDKLSSKRIKLPEDDFFAKDRLQEQENFAKLSAERQAMILLPYLQTTALANELIGLQMSIQSGYIKLKEKSTARKDRYSALAYANYLASILEKDLEEVDSNSDYKDYAALW